jgi:hypothetical protein
MRGYRVRDDEPFPRIEAKAFSDAERQTRGPRAVLARSFKV